MKKQQKDGDFKAKKRGAGDDGRAPRSDESNGCAASIERFGEALDKLKATPVTMTLEEACCLIGEGVDPQRFAWTAFEALALEIEAVAGIDGSGATTEAWRPLMSIAQRARLASKVGRQLSE